MSENSMLTPLLPFSAKPREEKRLYAPRDGSNAASVLSFRSKQTPSEPDDARITGTTRSLYRRLLALNLRKPVASQQEPDSYMPPLTA